MRRAIPLVLIAIAVTGCLNSNGTDPLADGAPPSISSARAVEPIGLIVGDASPPDTTPSSTEAAPSNTRAAVESTRPATAEAAPAAALNQPAEIPAAGSVAPTTIAQTTSAPTPTQPATTTTTAEATTPETQLTAAEARCLNEEAAFVASYSLDFCIQKVEAGCLEIHERCGEGVPVTEHFCLPVVVSRTGRADIDWKTTVVNIDTGATLISTVTPFNEAPPELAILANQHCPR